MKVQAITDGFYGGARRRAGDVFEAKDGVTSKWFTPVQVKEQAPVAKAGKAPKQKKQDDAVALSQLPADQQPASPDAPVATDNVADKEVI